MGAISYTSQALVAAPSTSPRNPSRARSSRTPAHGVPAPYVWTPRRRRCVAVVLIGGIRRRNRELRSTSFSSTRAYIGQVYSNASSAVLRVEG